MAYNSRDLINSLGKNFMLVINDELLAYGTSAGVRFGRETIDTTNYMSGGWRDELGGIKSWDLSGSAYVTLDKDKLSLPKLMDAFNSDQRVNVKFLEPSKDGNYTITDPKNVLAEGEAIITSLDVKGDTKGILTLDVSLQGCGPVKWKYDGTVGGGTPKNSGSQTGGKNTPSGPSTEGDTGY